MSNENIVYYWAQALDNSSPDHVKIGDRLLEPHEDEGRSEAMSFIQNIRFEGEEVVFNENSDTEEIRLAYHDGKFAVEVDCVERDIHNRVSKIVCAGYYTRPVDVAYSDALDRGLDNFAKIISRTIRPGTVHGINYILSRLSKLEKAKSNTKYLIIAIIFTAILVTLFLYLW